MKGKKRVHIYVSGRVQGVFFRDHTRRWAASLGIGGWVRNLADGRVEAVAEGDEKALDDFLARLRQGPPAALVENLEADWEPFLDEFRDFRVLATG